MVVMIEEEVRGGLATVVASADRVALAGTGLKGAGAIVKVGAAVMERGVGLDAGMKACGGRYDIGRSPGEPIEVFGVWMRVLSLWWPSGRSSFAFCLKDGRE